MYEPKYIDVYKRLIYIEDEQITHCEYMRIWLDLIKYARKEVKRYNDGIESLKKEDAGNK